MTSQNEKAQDEIAIALQGKDLDELATEPDFVALHLRQKFLPVEGPDGVIFPPTYANEDGEAIYNIDKLVDGTLVCTIDSVGSQANRLEPLFKAGPVDVAQDDNNKNLSLAKLVPQIDVLYGDNRKTSIFDAGHRLGDAIVRVSKDKSFDLPLKAKEAFASFLGGDATEIAKLAPTSLVFGVWDSRESQAKLPRILQSVVRAWNVSTLKRSAVYNAAIDYAKLNVFDSSTKEKAEKDKKRTESKRGFVNALATATPGGIVVHGAIWRDVTINLIALRRLQGPNVLALRRYILGLALVAAVEPFDGFLRSGCLITLDQSYKGVWRRVHRDGRRIAVEFERQTILDYAGDRTTAFVKGLDHQVTFQLDLAQEDAKKDENAEKRLKKEQAKKAKTVPNSDSETDDSDETSGS